MARGFGAGGVGDGLGLSVPGAVGGGASRGSNGSGESADTQPPPWGSGGATSVGVTQAGSGSWMASREGIGMEARRLARCSTDVGLEVLLMVRAETTNREMNGRDEP